MIDWHTHQKLNAVAQHRLHLESAQSAQQALDMVTAALSDPKYSSAVERNFVGVNLRNGTWPDPEKMCKASLDAISPERPVFLLWNGYHSMCVNTAGLKAVGKNPDEYPDGVLLEKEAFDVSGILSNLGEDVLDQWIFEEAKYAA
jgi:predicted amidohydrolase YtcJ